MSYIDKFKQPNGWYKSSDGLDFETVEDFIGHILEFCGCGMPEEAMRYVYESLKLANRYCRDEPYKVWKVAKDEHFKSNLGLEYFVWYYLTHLDLLEHGSSVPGWLTDKGQQLMVDLENVLNIDHA